MFLSLHKNIFLAAALWLSLSASGTAAPVVGTLILAHGGTSSWNKTVEALRQQLPPGEPLEIALGMADRTQIQSAINKLAARKVDKIVVVPLFISSYSEVLDHTRYVLGIRRDPSRELLAASHQGHHFELSLERVRTQIPLVLTPALDDHPLVAQILLDRVRVLSKIPSQESVVLVGHGPVDDRANQRWLQSMHSLGQKIKAGLGFQAVEAATLRDDAPPTVKDAAEKELRALVQRLSSHSRVLVVPHLVSQGGIEAHIQKALEGLPYTWSGQTLLPHPLIPQWIEKMTEAGAQKSNMRQWN